eukprot:1054287-Pyramimonas_sp.AAC.2
MALLIEKPSENIQFPNEASERVAISLSRLENDEQGESPQTNEGRALLIKMGRMPGQALVADLRREVDEAAQPDLWIFRRHHRAGLGTMEM